MNNISEYSIINTKEIKEKIKEIEDSYFKVKGNDDADEHYLDGARTYLKEILNNSISLEETLKSSFEAGKSGQHYPNSQIGYKFKFDSFEDYIKNLTIKK